MAYSFVLTATLPASAEEIYQAWLDSAAHSAMTGGEAIMSGRVGADVTAWDGYITGRNLELVSGQRIVQTWRTSDFSDAHEDSTIFLTLQNVPGGTLLTLEHKNVPDEQRSYEEDGWQANYFKPMAVYFAGRKQKVAKAKRSPKLKRAGTKKSKPAQKKTPPPTRQSRKKVRRKSVARKAKQRRGRRASSSR